MSKKFWVHPTTHRIVKFFPALTPDKGDIVLVDGERCKVLKVVKRRTELDGEPTWTIDGIKVHPV